MNLGLLKLYLYSHPLQSHKHLHIRIVKYVGSITTTIHAGIKLG